MKDYFSSHPDRYKAFRPTYPDELYTFLVSLVNEKEYAWDCGTGNGQVAVELARHFKTVAATDISREQLSEAPDRRNIKYSVQKAESTNFPDHHFDLITVAQAIHWFDFDEFYREVNRTLKNGGILTAVGYGLVETFPEADSIISHFYHDIVGAFWDEERRYIDEKYQTIPFPFQEIETPEFCSFFDWSFDYLIGYLGTWSSVQHFKNRNRSDPVEFIFDELKSCWKNETRTVRFPIFLRLGQTDK